MTIIVMVMMIMMHDDNGNDKFIFEQLYSAFFICPVVLCNENRF